MEQETPAAHIASTVDTIASRLKLYATALLSVAAVTSLLTAATVSYVTKDIREEVVQARGEVRQLAQVARTRAQVDSVRFERVMQVVELAVVAIVEPQGSDEQRSAVVALRKSRKVIPGN